MNKTHMGLAVLAFALVASGCAPEYSRYHNRERREVRDTLALMSPQDVIALTKAKIGDRVIIEMIQNTGSEFHLRTPDVIALADSGVSDTVISAMMRTDQPGGGGDGEEHGRYYAGYPFYPYAWWGASPWWSPWYFSSYWGYWGGYYFRPHYSFHSYAPYYGGYRNRSYGVGGGGGGGGNRPMGGRRR